MKILVNSCIREVDRIEMKASRKSCIARLREGEGGRHAVIKFRRAASMKIMEEDSKRLKIVSKRKGNHKTEKL